MSDSAATLNSFVLPFAIYRLVKIAFYCMPRIHFDCAPNEALCELVNATAVFLSLWQTLCFLTQSQSIIWYL